MRKSEREKKREREREREKDKEKERKSKSVKQKIESTRPIIFSNSIIKTTHGTRDGTLLSGYQYFRFY